MVLLFNLRSTYTLPSPIFYAFSGLVHELRDIQVAQVCLGKAHAVVLTSKGAVYTFGINNKGQCGRDFTTHGITPRDGK